MAREKKEKLSLDELLEQVLIKEEEQPYKVPSNWVWTNIENICEKITDGEHIKPKRVEQGIALLTAKNILDNTIDFSDVEYVEQEVANKSWQRCHPKLHDILICSRGTIGRNTIVNVEIPFCLMGTVILLRMNNMLNKKFYNYLIKSNDMQNKMATMCGSTAVKALYLKDIKKLMVPLPPLAEQQRIVDRIESLFEKLDAAKELIQNALDSFEKRKVAILHKAFTGELTAKWREENGVSLDSWEEYDIEKLGEVKGGKRLPKGEVLVNENTGFPYIKAGDLKNGTVLLDQLQYVTPEIQQVIKNYTVNKGDIYITIVGACIGDVGIIPEEADGANLTENAAKITNLKCNNKYLATCLASGKLQEQIKGKIASATLGKLSLTSIKSISVPVPILEEQCEIVAILEKLLSNEQQAQELCDIIEKIDLMKKSILARAFRGELGTNNPDEDSAENLLREILEKKLS